jgi:hypothetical protein
LIKICYIFIVLLEVKMKIVVAVAMPALAALCACSGMRKADSVPGFFRTTLGKARAESERIQVIIFNDLDQEVSVFQDGILKDTLPPRRTLTVHTAAIRWHNHPYGRRYIGILSIRRGDGTQTSYEYDVWPSRDRVYSYTVFASRDPSWRNSPSALRW